eukprot:6263795-Prymnesium_polylepis.2
MTSPASENKHQSILTTPRGTPLGWEPHPPFYAPTKKGKCIEVKTPPCTVYAYGVQYTPFEHLHCNGEI